MTYPPPPGPQPPYQGGPPPWPYYQAAYPRQSPAQKSSVPVWVWIFLGALILPWGGCLGLFATTSDESSPTSSRTTQTTTLPLMAPDASTASAAPAPPVGSAVRDGQFEFLVTKVEQGAETVGEGFWSEQAKGEFVLIYVDITNIGKEPRRYSSSNQQLFDDRGREFSSSFSADIALNDYGSSEELNPGHQISVVLAFDVPAGTVPAAVEFHDSMFSGGAKVALR